MLNEGLGGLNIVIPLQIHHLIRLHWQLGHEPKEGVSLLHFFLLGLNLDLQGSGLALEPNKAIF